MPGPRPSPEGTSSKRHHEARGRNARIAVAARRHHFDLDAHVPFICECDNSGCEALIRLTLTEYETARSAADYFVAPGHQVGNARIVRVRDGCWLYAAELA